MSMITKFAGMGTAVFITLLVMSGCNVGGVLMLTMNVAQWFFVTLLSAALVALSLFLLTVYAAAVKRDSQPPPEEAYYISIADLQRSMEERHR